jgi:hypothetical protein
MNGRNDFEAAVAAGREARLLSALRYFTGAVGAKEEIVNSIYSWATTLVLGLALWGWGEASAQAGPGGGRAGGGSGSGGGSRSGGSSRGSLSGGSFSSGSKSSSGSSRSFSSSSKSDHANSKASTKSQDHYQVDVLRGFSRQLAPGTTNRTYTSRPVPRPQPSNKLNDKAWTLWKHGISSQKKTGKGESPRLREQLQQKLPKENPGRTFRGALTGTSPNRELALGEEQHRVNKSFVANGGKQPPGNQRPVAKVCLWPGGPAAKK